MPKVPIDNPDKDGRPRKQFTVKKPNDEQEYAWTINIKSPLYRDLLGFLPNEITGKFPSEISGKRVPSCSASYGPEKGGPTRATQSKRLKLPTMATIESYRLHEAKKLIDEAYERIHDAYNRYNPTNKSQ